MFDAVAAALSSIEFWLAVAWLVATPLQALVASALTRAVAHRMGANTLADLRLFFLGIGVFGGALVFVFQVSLWMLSRYGLLRLDDLPTLIGACYSAMWIGLFFAFYSWFLRR